MELKVELTLPNDSIFDGSIEGAMMKLGIEAQAHAQNTVDTFTNSKGHQQGVGSGAFRDSIKSEVVMDGIAFKLSDGVPYGIYHEYGTEPHWVPFFDKDTGEITSLGEWAMVNFKTLKYEVTGKKGKPLKKPSRASREDLLRKKGGITVSLDEMAPFRKALEHTKTIAGKIFIEELENVRN